MSGIGRPSESYIHAGDETNISDFTDINMSLDHNTYESLAQAPSRASLLPANTPPPSPRDVSAYLQPVGSQHCDQWHSHCGSSRYPTRHKWSGCKRSHCNSSSSRTCSSSRRRRSRSSTSSEEMMETFYMKVKIWLLLLSVFITVVAAGVVFLVVRAIDMESISYFLDAGDGKSFKLCTKCQPLEAKMGILGTNLIKDIQSSKYPGFCCFRRVDQLLDTVDGYNQVYIEQELGRISERFKSPSNKPSLPHEPIAAHMFYKETSKDSVLAWTQSGKDIRLNGLNMRDDKYLEIEDAGYYYMYSHIQFKNPTVNSKHTVKAGIHTMDQDIGQRSSLVQGVLRLAKGDTISVIVDNKLNIDTAERKNYFGIFKL